MSAGAAASSVVRAGVIARTAAAPVRPRGPGHRGATTLAHEVPPAAVMAVACLAGNAAALCAGAVALALLACGYGRMARRSWFGREHVVDLWAMLLVMVGTAFSGGDAGGMTMAAAAGPAAGATHGHHAVLAAGPLGSGLVGVAVGGWLVGRLLLARRVRRLHTAVSAIVCGGMLLAMLAM